MKTLLVLALVVVVAVIGAGLAWRQRRIAEQRRTLRAQRRREQQETWNQYMAGKPPGPGHNSR